MASQTFIKAWKKFWFERSSTFSLGMFRILFAYCLFREVGNFLTHSVYGIRTSFHLPYFDWIPLFSPYLYQWVHYFQYPLIIAVALGIAMRPALVLLVFLQSWVFFADQMSFRNHPYFFLLISFLLIFSPADESLSLKPLLDRKKRKTFSVWNFFGADKPVTISRLIQLQVCIAYFYAGLHKLNGSFLSGKFLQVQLTHDIQRWQGLFPPAWIHALQDWFLNLTLLMIASIGSAGLELALPFALWFPRTRKWAMIIGAVFHLSIGFLMNIWTFSFAMLGTYLLFMNSKALAETFEAFLQKPLAIKKPKRKSK